MMTENGTVTAKDLAKKWRTHPRTLNNWWDRIAKEGKVSGKFDRNRPLDPREIDLLSENLKERPDRERDPDQDPRPRKSERKERKEKGALQKRVDRFLENPRLDSINLLEIGLIYRGLWVLFNISGLILATMAGLYLLETQSLAKDIKRGKTSERATSVALWLCLASVGLHSITFFLEIQRNFNWIHTSGRLDQSLFIHLIAAIAPAVYVGVLSYNAILTTRAKTEEV